MSQLKEKILAKIQYPTLSALATVTEDGNPWVRYVMTWADDSLNLWVTTFVGSRKVEQIRRNPEVHVTAGVTDLETAESYLQIQGRAEVLTDPETKQAVWQDFLKSYFSGPEDPNFAVLKIVPYRIEYQGMGMTPAEVWEV